MHRSLVGVSSLKTLTKAIEDTGTTNVMNLNYGSFLSYQQSYNGEYVTLLNGAK